jgi:gamma-glutamyltranspeptidase/glutathione hydrolase
MVDFTQPYPSQRSPVLGDNVVATSQPLAAQAGLAMLAKGGNAVDAAIAAAMTLTVVEPTGCGLGSDAFAVLWDGKELHGLNASGRAPAAWTPERFAGQTAMPTQGWDSVTVPGAVSGWIALWQRFGSLPLEVIAAPAIRYARDGFAVSPIIARLWQMGGNRLGREPGFAEVFLPDGRAPHAGERFRNPALAATLETIVATEGESFYRGALAEKLAAHAKAHGGGLTVDDLNAHRADWVGTIAQDFASGTVHEIPPNGQGIVTLITLGILEELGIGADPVDDVETLHLAIEATKLALADADQHVADSHHMAFEPTALLDPDYLASRAALVDRAQAGLPAYGAPKPGGTVYLAAADASGMMISFIQSNYMGFGSGVVVPGTGISLQNRGAGFSLQEGHVNRVVPGKRPFHTIIPGFAMAADGKPLSAFGVMGGPMQAQGHTQMMLRRLVYRQNPQAAADAPRWRVVGGRRVAVEARFPAATADALRARGHDIVVEPPDGVFAFGGAQIIECLPEGQGGYVAGSDPRKDGQAVAF